MHVKPWDFSFLRRYESPNDDGAGGNGDGKPTGDDGNKPKGPEITPEIQAVIDSAAAAARKQAEKDARAKFEKDAADAAAVAETERQRKAAEERGEFDTVKASLEKDATDAKAERDALKAELEAIWTDRRATMTEGMKTLPKELPDWRYYPGDEATDAAKWSWYQKASTSHTEDATAKRDALNLNRLPASPRPNGPTNQQKTETEQAARLRAARAYTG